MIFVFKTSVTTTMQILQLKPHIDNMLPGVKWNFDLEDNDKNWQLITDNLDNSSSYIWTAPPRGFRYRRIHRRVTVR